MPRALIPQQFTVVFEPDEDVMTPPTHDDDSQPRVYVVDAFVNTRVPLRGVPSFDPRDVEIVDVRFVDEHGDEMPWPSRIWGQAEALEELTAAVLIQVEKEYWDSDGGA